MKKICTFFNSEESNSDNFAYNSSENLPLDENIDPDKDSKLAKVTHKKLKKKFIVSKEGKKRKDKEDNIRKKIKTCSLKNLKNNINKKLKKVGSKYTFTDLPQHFIADISRKTNHEVMKLTYGELFEYTHKKLINDLEYKAKDYNKKKIKAAEDKYLINKKTLEYLNSNPEISIKSGWEKIKNTKYVDLLSDVFNSKEFEKSFQDLSKKEEKYYIKLYKYFADDYIKFFRDYQPNEKGNKKKKKLLLMITAKIQNSML